jgi:hypothetical protein
MTTVRIIRRITDTIFSYGKHVLCLPWKYVWSRCKFYYLLISTFTSSTKLSSFSSRSLNTSKSAYNTWKLTNHLVLVL